MNPNNPNFRSVNRNLRRRFQVKGFRPGNVPYKQTELENVIISKDPLSGNLMVYQVKRRGPDGKPAELYTTTTFRAFRIYWRFKFHDAKKWLYRNLKAGVNGGSGLRPHD